MRTRTASILIAHLVCAACASSRVRGNDDADGGDPVAADGTGAADVDASGAGPIDGGDDPRCEAVALETVAAWPKLTGSLQTSPSLAVGPGGELAVAYNVDEGSVMVARRGAGTWSPELVAVLGSWPSIAFSSDGTLHVCFVRARSDAQGPLECASRPPGGTWSSATVDANPSQVPSAVVDTFGRLNVGYVRADGVAIASQSSGGGWSIYVMSAAMPQGASLAYDAQGREHVVWTMWSEGIPTLFERATGFMDGTHAWVRPRSLAIDAGGRVHVAFARHRNEQLSYAYRDPDHVWHFEHGLDGEGQIVPVSMALAIGATSEPHVTYHARSTAQTPARVLHAVRSGSAWATETIYEAPTDHWTTTDTAAGPDGHVHIVFDALPPATPDLLTVYYVRRCGVVDPP